MPADVPVPLLHRRAVLAGALALAAGGLGALVAACGGPAPGSATPPSVGPTPGGPTPAPTSAPTPSASVGASLTLRARVGRLLVVGFRGTAFDPSDPVMGAIAAGELGGAILFDRDHLTKTAGRNITGRAQLAALTRALRAARTRAAAAGSASPSRFLVAIDQEGGLVARLNASDGWSATPSEAELGAANDLARTTAVAMTTATWLRDAGVDLDLAPVVDLDVDPTSPAIGSLDRSFSADPSVVVAQSRAVIEAHHARGRLCAIKHFPGEGSSTGNTDLGVVDVTGTWTDAELRPFADLIAEGLPDAVMVGNVLDASIDAAVPLSLSPAAIDGVLRGRLGWSGVVVTDDLQAGAIRAAYGVEEAAVRAIAAGADLVLLANQQVYDAGVVHRVVDAILSAIAAGRLDEARIDAAVARVEAMLAARG